MFFLVQGRFSPRCFMFLFYVYKCSFQFHVKVHHLGKCKEIYSMTKYICGILCASSFVVKSVRHLVSQFRLCFVCGVRSLLNYLSAWIRVVDCHKKSLKTAFVCTFPISDVLMFCFVKNSTWYWHDQVRTYWTNHSTMWGIGPLQSSSTLSGLGFRLHSWPNVNPSSCALLTVFTASPCW